MQIVLKRSALQPYICHDVLEAQQKAIDKNPRMPFFYNLNIDAGALWARQSTACGGANRGKGAPWVIRTDDLARADIRHAADARRTRQPPSRAPRQNEMAFLII